MCCDCLCRVCQKRSLWAWLPWAQRVARKHSLWLELQHFWDDTEPDTARGKGWQMTWSSRNFPDHLLLFCRQWSSQGRQRDAPSTSGTSSSVLVWKPRLAAARCAAHAEERNEFSRCCLPDEARLCNRGGRDPSDCGAGPHPLYRGYKKSHKAVLSSDL